MPSGPAGSEVEANATEGWGLAACGSGTAIGNQAAAAGPVPGDAIWPDAAREIDAGGRGLGEKT